MKKITVLLTVFVLVMSMFSMPILAHTGTDMRAVWISTVYNLDYPSTKNNMESQKSEFIDILDQVQAMGLNTVIVQVRPKADALYRSSINPWSDVLTGTQGKDPGYDPLAFMIEEAHARNMELHAWLNPYRVTTTGTDLTALSDNHPARLNPSWTFTYNNALYYNPQVEGVKQHIADTVAEIAMNYNVDAIHFDDYFYPSSYPLSAGQTRDGEEANKRRENVNEMVQRASKAIKEANAKTGRHVEFGISPAGIWKNSSSDVTGSQTAGNESYYSVYADTRTWIQNEWIDYVIPQIYWETGHAKADYETLVKWWANEVADTNVKLYIGQGVYRDTVATQISKQLAINAQYPNVKGSCYFSLRDLLNNRMNCKTQIKEYYTAQGITGEVNNNNSNNHMNQDNSSNDVIHNDSVTNESMSVDPNAVGKTGVVTATTLNLRAGARIDREIITKVSQGTSLNIKAILNGWYKVALADGTVGWVSASYVKVQEQESIVAPPTSSNVQKPSAQTKGVVTADTLNVRSGPGATYDIVSTLVKGTNVGIYFKQGNWYKIQMGDGLVGWASAAYIA